MTGATAFDQDQDSPDLPHVEVIESGDEDDRYSSRVKTRINKEVSKRHAAERDRDAALARARELEDRLARAEDTGLSYYERTVTGELEQAEQEVAAAFESGDAARHAAAQRKLADAAAKAREVETLKASRPQPGQSRSQSNAPQVSARTQDWIKRNDWFQRDQAMTQAALAIHADIVSRGVEPDTDGYFSNLDRRMRAAFPDRFDEDGGEGEDDLYAEVEPAPRRAAPQRTASPSPVAPAARTPAGTTAASRPGTVRLTSEQVEAARDMGISPQQYAAQLVKLQRTGKVS